MLLLVVGALMPALPILADGECNSGGGSREIYALVDVNGHLLLNDRDPVGCVFWGQKSPPCAQLGFDQISTGPASCKACFSSQTALQSGRQVSFKEQVGDGAFGLFRTKVKFARPPAEMHCLEMVGATPTEESLWWIWGNDCPSLKVAPIDFWTFDRGFRSAMADLELLPVTGAAPDLVAGRVDRAVELGAVLRLPEADAAGLLDVGDRDFSLEGWIRTDPHKSVRVVLSKRQGPSGPFIPLNAKYVGYQLYLYNGQLGLQMADGQPKGKGGQTWSNYTVPGSDPANRVDDGRWHHFAVSVDRDQPDGIRFFRDGKEVGQRNPLGRQATLDNDADLRVGGQGSAAGKVAVQLDELGVYWEALSAGDVSALHQASVQGRCILRSGHL